MKKLLVILAATLMLVSCENYGITSVDYSSGQVRLTNKTKTQSIIDDKPAINLTIKNEGETLVWDILITVKAKRKTVDIDIQTIELDRLDSLETVERMVVFENLTTHADYDLLTYAIAFSN